jgi:hypothetical protein
MIAPTPDQQQDYISPCGEKTVELIQRLPEEEVTWVVYNANMIQYAESLIILNRGIEYFEKYVNVISCDNPEEVVRGALYLDPSLYDLKGNGYD